MCWSGPKKKHRIRILPNFYLLMLTFYFFNSTFFLSSIWLIDQYCIITLVNKYSKKSSCADQVLKTRSGSDNILKTGSGSAGYATLVYRCYKKTHQESLCLTWHISPNVAPNTAGGSGSRKSLDPVPVCKKER